jgi:hypothetical protein
MQQEEITVQTREAGIQVMGDMQPFQAPDGTVITGRRKWRQYCKEKGVTHVSDYNKPGGYWDKKRTEREKVFTPGAGFDSARRKQHIANAIEKLRSK